jgi:hypothetical protein
MLEFFTYLSVGWAIGTALSWVLRSRVEAEQRDELRAILNEKIRVVHLETVENNLILAYDSENNQYLGQGTDVATVKQNLTLRFPNRIFLLNGEPFSAKELNLQDTL